ncbi:D-malate degradation protein R [Serratia proteamaculans]|jgi:DNA-binding transcriptional LysR family regulator|uniref:LysR family transcriptional regulator n=1 Tax=Serratia proteamaculans TaxID=28151 RepID=A0ABS0TR77_SERPR|nr:LysR family transcriptional regulator [Serratia proteamaculans]KAB1494053.1 LysR family transcriptional regulator [Serratia proteamaculans]MBI6180831.1 LysR family transcriptional regulator [Serratia proteamaculans]RYM48656.1 LysR family transcriptional regulator [Serratia proteamaculans]RYM54838.1 LysR family transcriptional regulator [Serratia proteamaculans]CAI1027743.1 D-malate degradation protein R [Serratia proteamaculans]
MDRITAAEVFITIVDRGSMIAAAETLEMSRAMVTRYLAQMEQWAGARLLHRTTRKLSLTDAGERTLERCRQMLALAGEIDLVEGEQSDELRGLLRITCSQSLGQTALVGAVAQYLKRHPQVAVDLQMNNRTVNLVEERIDLALRITNELDPNLIARPLSSCASVVCASPAYLAAYGTPRHPQDLALHNCLTYSYFGKSLWHFDHQGVKSAVAVSGNLSANESVVLMAGTVQGAGISMQPYYSAAPLLASGDLIELMPEYRPQSMGIYGIYTSRRQMPATLRTMLDFLVEWFATDASWRATLR